MHSAVTAARAKLPDAAKARDDAAAAGRCRRSANEAAERKKIARICSIQPTRVRPVAFHRSNACPGAEVVRQREWKRRQKMPAEGRCTNSVLADSV